MCSRRSFDAPLIRQCQTQPGGHVGIRHADGQDHSVSVALQVGKGDIATNPGRKAELRAHGRYHCNLGIEHVSRQPVCRHATPQHSACRIVLVIHRTCMSPLQQMLGGGQARRFQADVADVKQIEALFDQVLTHFGGIDILINNAGIMKNKPVEQVSEEEFDQIFSVNVKGMFFCCQQAVRKMNPGGKIINLGTSVTKVMLPTYSTYAMSKGSVEQLTRVLAKEVGVKQTVVRMDRPDYASLVQKMGIDLALSPRHVMGNRIMAMVLGGRIKAVSLMEEGKVEIIEFLAEKSTRVVDRPLSEVGKELPDGVLICAIVRHGHVVVPGGDDIGTKTRTRRYT